MRESHGQSRAQETPHHSQIPTPLIQSVFKGGGDTTGTNPAAGGRDATGNMAYALMRAGRGKSYMMPCWFCARQGALTHQTNTDMGLKEHEKYVQVTEGHWKMYDLTGI